MERKKLGAFGENLAAKFLKDLKYKILLANYRCPHGEIDIVAMEGKTLVFIEVKTRSSEDYGKGAEAVNYKKQKKIRTVALNYIGKNSVVFSNIRFDVIDITVKDNIPQIYHIKNAF